MSGMSSRSREKLVDLMVLCLAGHDSHWIESSEFMPTMQGPSFGSIDYADHYCWEIKMTAAQLKVLLSSVESKRVHF